jgi:hypothetical protein
MQFLRFRVEAGVLGEHLQNSGSNATYISKTTQDQLIEACGSVVREVILKRIKEAKYFSVVFDVPTDISTISQLSNVITYTQRYEDFVEFIDDHKTVFEDREASQEPKVIGELLGKLVLKKLKEF